MKIYTKTGDAGQTGLVGGTRVEKDHVRIAAYGDVDELNSVLGFVRASWSNSPVDSLLEAIQHDLFAVGAELATPDSAERGVQLITASRITALEEAIDANEAKLEPLQEFILPGGSLAASTVHLARTVCRRAERGVVTLRREPDIEVRDELLVYLNRLSDLLFVLARVANLTSGEPDIPWRKPPQSPRV